jgi:hypothetical protein
MLLGYQVTGGVCGLTKRCASCLAFAAARLACAHPLRRAPTLTAPSRCGAAVTTHTHTHTHTTRQIEAVWHTGVVLDGRTEYFFGYGINTGHAGATMFGPPARVLDMG